MGSGGSAERIRGHVNICNDSAFPALTKQEEKDICSGRLLGSEGDQQVYQEMLGRRLSGDHILR